VCEVGLSDYDVGAEAAAYWAVCVQHLPDTPILGGRQRAVDTPYLGAMGYTGDHLWVGSEHEFILGW